MEDLEKELATDRAFSQSVYQHRLQSRIQRSRGLHGANVPDYTVGDLVFVAHIDKLHTLHKLQARWKGPFKVHRVINNYVYEIQDLRNFPDISDHLTMHHAIRLRLFSPATANMKITESLRRHIEYSISLFQVAEIIQHRFSANNTPEVFIKWLGLAHYENTWHSFKFIYSKAPSECEEYLKKLPDFVRSQLRTSL
jgi:hypothetical protein